MSKTIDLLKAVILNDSEGNRSRIISVRGAEEELDHIEIITQSAYEKELGIKTRHRIYAEEI